MINVAVIIPYYQKKPGILGRALESILHQNLLPGVRVNIIIVDDASPVPARAEVAKFVFSPPLHLTVIEQPNGGVAAARNTGLENVPADTTYIAFLDSDDIWNPAHLPTAISALEAGFDFYFDDHSRIGAYDSCYLSRPFSPPPLTHPIGGNLHEIDRDSFVDAFIRFVVAHISTVVYRRSVAPELRLNAVLRLAGEDVLFLSQIAYRCKRLCYSSDILVTCGDGVNIWSSRYSWDAPMNMPSQLSRLMSLQEIKKALPLSKQNNAYISGLITKLRRFFAYLSIREIVKRRQLWPSSVNDMRHYDPAFLIWYPLCLLYVAIFYPLHLYRPQDD